MKIGLFLLCLGSFCSPFAQSEELSQNPESWFCLAQDRLGSNYTSGFTETLGGAQKQALDFCFSFSDMPSTCRVLSCEKVKP